MEGRLIDWIAENYAATRSGDVSRTAQVAEGFNEIIRSVLARRRPDPPELTAVTGQQLQSQLRGDVTDSELESSIDELLRRDSPFIGNRRVTTRAVNLDGTHIPEGTRVKLHWTSANRDEKVFGDANSYDPDAHAPHNLVYGIGKHVCPGRALATIELRTLVRALLAGTTTLELDPQRAPVREVAPVGGWARVPVLLG